MPRTKTEKATYARFEVRLPQPLLEAYRRYADREGRAMNTQLVRSLQEWMEHHGIAPEQSQPSSQVG